MRLAFIGVADACERVVATALTLLMGMMVVLGFYQVLARFVLHEPSPWTEEVLRRAMIWMVALGLSIGFRHGAHICVEIIKRAPAQWIRSGVTLLVFWLTLLFLVTLVWLGADMAWRVRFQTFGSLDISMTWAYAAIPVGAAFSVVALLARFIDERSDEESEFGGLKCQE